MTDEGKEEGGREGERQGGGGECSSQDAMHQPHQMLAKKESKTTIFVKTEDTTFDVGHFRVIPRVLFSVSMCVQQQCTREKPQPTSIQQLIGYQKLPQANHKQPQSFFFTPLSQIVHAFSELIPYT